jgi:hypothetical protein
MPKTKPSQVTLKSDGTAHIYLKNCKKPAIVDISTLSSIAGWRFYMNWVEKKSGEGWVRGYRNGERAYLHRILTNAPQGRVVDHVDGDTLNNRMSNLRVVTIGENNKNKGSTRHYLNGNRTSMTVEGNKLIRVTLCFFGFHIEKIFLNTDDASKGKKRVLEAKNEKEAIKAFCLEGWSVECKNCFKITSDVMKCRKCGNSCCNLCSNGGVCQGCLVEDGICC